MLALLAVDMGRDRDALVARTLPAEDPTRGKLEQVPDNTDQAIAEGRDQLRELRMRDSAGLERILGDALRKLQETYSGIVAGVEGLGCPGRQGHWGLVGMRERAARIGGRLSVASAAGSGATVCLVVPLPPEPDQA